MKLGDAIASVATPIARTLGMPCIDPETQQLRPESTCNKVRELANQGRYREAFYERFWSTKNKGEKMQFIITKQIAVEAETPEEAVSKIAEGKTIALNVAARPAPPQPQAQPVQMGPGGVPMPAIRKVG